MESISGCGIGLRKEFLHEVKNFEHTPSWFEITPENWITTPKSLKKDFESVVRDFPIVCHGVSLSIGSYEELNIDFLKKLKTFLDDYEIEHYSEHISFSSLEGRQTYELLPIPMTQEMIQRVSQKVDFVQNFLQRELILENATYYYVPQSDMSEVDFINELVKTSGAKLLFDVNNVYVNGFNHGFDVHEFIDKIDLERVAYYHVAGHLEYREDLWIDTHGMKVKPEVWDLLEYTLKQKKAPVLLERDNNVPNMSAMMKEYNTMRAVYERV